MKIQTNVKAGSACYTVVSGDSLATIAQRFYGAQTLDGVSKIYFSNITTIGPNPNLIIPGQKLFIPD